VTRSKTQLAILSTHMHMHTKYQQQQLC